MLAYRDKIMFEIYRDKTYSEEYRVVYFTELNEHNKSTEIDRAMGGEHFFDGYILTLKKERAAERIGEIISRLNKGEPVDPLKIEQDLAEYLVK